MGSTHAGHNAADKWPLMPAGGYLRATQRDALTGEPIRPETVKVRVHDHLAARDNGPHSAMTTPKRGHHARRLPPCELPTLSLDDDAVAEAQEAVDDAE